MLKSLKEIVNNMPIIGYVVKLLKQFMGRKQDFFSSNYWESRYLSGENSGVGSYGKFAKFKAEILNEFVGSHEVQTIIELGCGDGNQLALANYPHYIGLDISQTAIEICQAKFQEDKSKQFCIYTPKTFDNEISNFLSELSLSLDVIYHLVEDEVFITYMKHLFAIAEKYVIIYASDQEDIEGYSSALHVKHRDFSAWINVNIEQWKLKQKIVNKYPYQGDYTQGSFSNFCIYEKI